MLVRGGRHHHEAHYGAVSVCVERTAPAGGWIRRRRRRATERRRAGKRQIELSLNGNFFFFQISIASCKEHFVLWEGGEGAPIGMNRMELSINKSKCEGAG